MIIEDEIDTCLEDLFEHAWQHLGHMKKGYHSRISSKASWSLRV
jgi:hypothetical protein